MNIDIHNDDELYRQAYERLEGDPAPQVWEKVAAELDNNAAQYYHKKFINWRLTSWLLLTALMAVIAGGVWFFNKNKLASHYNNTISQNNKQQTDETAKHTTVPATANTAKKHAPQLTGTGVKQNDAGTGEQSAEPVQNNHLAQSVQPVRATGWNQKITGSEITKNAITPLMLQVDIAEANGNVNRPKWYTAEKGTIVRSTTMYPFLNPGLINAVRLPAITLNTPAMPGNASTRAKKIVIKRKLFKTGVDLTAYSSVDFPGYIFDEGHDHTSGQQDNMHEIKERERPEAGLSAGLVVKLPLGEKLQLKTGLVYSNATIDIGEQKVYAAVDGNNTIGYKFITSAGYAYIKPGGVTPAAGDSATTHHAHLNQQYISVPVMAGYTLYSNKRLSITPLLGVTANILLGTHVTTVLEGSINEKAVSVNHLSGQRPWYPSLTGAAAVKYTISSRLAVNLFPSFKYAVSPSTQGGIIKAYPYSLNLGLGLTYKF